MKTKNASLKSQKVELSSSALRHLPRPRSGFERFVEPLLSFYESQRTLLGGGVDLKDLRARFARYQSMAETEQSTRGQLAEIEHVRFSDAATLWRALLDIYAKAQVAARLNPAVARSIADFSALMQRQPRRPRKVPVPVTNS